MPNRLLSNSANSNAIFWKDLSEEKICRKMIIRSAVYSNSEEKVNKRPGSMSSLSKIQTLNTSLHFQLSRRHGDFHANQSKAADQRFHRAAAERREAVRGGLLSQ